MAQFSGKKIWHIFLGTTVQKWVALVALRKIWCSWGNEPFCCKIQYYYYYDFKPYRKKPLQKMKIKNIKSLYKRFSFLLVKLTGHLLELGWGWKKIKLCTFIKTINLHHRMQIGFDSSECYVFPSILFYPWNSYRATNIFYKEPIKMYARYLSIGIYSSCIRAGRFFRKHKRQQGIRVLMSKICCSYTTVCNCQAKTNKNISRPSPLFF